MSDSIERNSGAPYVRPDVSQAIAAMPEPYREWFALAHKLGVSRRQKTDGFIPSRAIRFAQAHNWHIIDTGDQLILIASTDVKILC